MNALGLSPAVWRTSRRSQQSGACVAVARLSQVMAVRDSKNPGGGNLVFTLQAWQAFSQDVKHGTHDL
ncbi:DUF397 domain-containing protein [Actinomadura oligospora]|uniref:DUF397 domain-containing protein n=1 Tax=Actinomadura oligospora TaxID=111804 RepID=UPI0009FED3DD|nr:DUF397 domain-containing protein [Actinomadura oligospora]